MIEHKAASPHTFPVSVTHHRNYQNATNVPHDDKTVQKQLINWLPSKPDWTRQVRSLVNRLRGSPETWSPSLPLLPLLPLLVPPPSSPLGRCVDVDCSELSHTKITTRLFTEPPGRAPDTPPLLTRGPFTIKVFMLIGFYGYKYSDVM